MLALVEKIYKSVMELVLNVCGGMVDWVLKLVLKIGINTAYIESLFPVLGDIYSYMEYIGLVVAGFILVIGFFKMLFPFSGGSQSADNVIQLSFRYATALVGIKFFKQVFETYIYNGFIRTLFNAFNTGLVVTNPNNFGDYIAQVIVFGVDGNGKMEYGHLGQLCIALILLVYLVVVLIKFLVFHFEKFFFTTFLMYCSPLTASTIVSKNTVSIFTNYFKMLLTNSATLVFNIITLKMVMSGLYNLADFKAGPKSGNLTSFVIGTLLVTSVIKVGKKMSVYISQLFNMSGMSDTIRDGLGGVGMALGTLAMGKKLFGGNNNPTKNAKEVKNKTTGSDTGNGGGSNLVNNVNQDGKTDTPDKNKDVKGADIGNGKTGAKKSVDTGKGGMGKASSADNYQNPNDKKKEAPANTEDKNNSSNAETQNKSENADKNEKGADTSNTGKTIGNPNDAKENSNKEGANTENSAKLNSNLSKDEKGASTDSSNSSSQHSENQKKNSANSQGAQTQKANTGTSTGENGSSGKGSKENGSVGSQTQKVSTNSGNGGKTNDSSTSSGAHTNSVTGAQGSSSDKRSSSSSSVSSSSTSSVTTNSKNSTASARNKKQGGTNKPNTPKGIYFNPKIDYKSGNKPDRKPTKTDK